MTPDTAAHAIPSGRSAFEANVRSRRSQTISKGWSDRHYSPRSDLDLIALGLNPTAIAWGCRRCRIKRSHGVKAFTWRETISSWLSGVVALPPAG